MSKIVNADQMTDAIIEALKSRGVEILPEVLAAAVAEANDNVDEVDELDEDYDDESDYDNDSPYSRLADGTYFADPGGNSALRAASRDNPRNLPCPTCEQPNRLTPADRARNYQCDSCADMAERGGY